MSRRNGLAWWPSMLAALGMFASLAAGRAAAAPARSALPLLYPSIAEFTKALANPKSPVQVELRVINAEVTKTADGGIVWTADSKRASGSLEVGAYYTFRVQNQTKSPLYTAIFDLSPDRKDGHPVVYLMYPDREDNAPNDYPVPADKGWDVLTYDGQSPKLFVCDSPGQDTLVLVATTVPVQWNALIGDTRSLPTPLEKLLRAKLTGEKTAANPALMKEWGTAVVAF